jgi:hypothetical protein
MEKVQNLKNSNTAPSSKTFRDESQQNALHSYFTFERSWVQNTIQKLAILTEVFSDFPQSLQTNARIV